MNYYEICPFLNYKNECDIYNDRPAICKYYTCENFKNKNFSNEFIKKLKNENYKLIDLRKEFFEG